MLVQRLAKEALMGMLPSVPEQGEPRGSSTFAELVGGLEYLDRLPLTNAEIARELEATHLAWQAFQLGLADRATSAACAYIATSSEALFGHFDRITDLIERGIHALMGF